MARGPEQSISRDSSILSPEQVRELAAKIQRPFGQIRSSHGRVPPKNNVATSNPALARQALSQIPPGTPRLQSHTTASSFRLKSSKAASSCGSRAASLLETMSVAETMDTVFIHDPTFYGSDDQASDDETTNVEIMRRQLRKLRSDSDASTTTSNGKGSMILPSGASRPRRAGSQVSEPLDPLDREILALSNSPHGVEDEYSSPKGYEVPWSQESAGPQSAQQSALLTAGTGLFKKRAKNAGNAKRPVSGESWNPGDDAHYSAGASPNKLRRPRKGPLETREQFIAQQSLGASKGKTSTAEIPANVANNASRSVSHRKTIRSYSKKQKSRSRAARRMPTGHELTMLPSELIVQRNPFPDVDAAEVQSEPEKVEHSSPAPKDISVERVPSKLAGQKALKEKTGKRKKPILQMRHSIRMVSHKTWRLSCYKFPRQAGVSSQKEVELASWQTRHDGFTVDELKPTAPPLIQLGAKRQVNRVPSTVFPRFGRLELVSSDEIDKLNGSSNDENPSDTSYDAPNDSHTAGNDLLPDPLSRSPVHEPQEAPSQNIQLSEIVDGGTQAAKESDGTKRRVTFNASEHVMQFDKSRQVRQLLTPSKVGNGSEVDEEPYAEADNVSRENEPRQEDPREETARPDAIVQIGDDEDTNPLRFKPHANFLRIRHIKQPAGGSFRGEGVQATLDDTNLDDQGYRTTYGGGFVPVTRSRGTSFKSAGTSRQAPRSTSRAGSQEIPWQPRRPSMRGPLIEVSESIEASVGISSEQPKRKPSSHNKRKYSSNSGVRRGSSLPNSRRVDLQAYTEDEGEDVEVSGSEMAQLEKDPQGRLGSQPPDSPSPHSHIGMHGSSQSQSLEASRMSSVQRPKSDRFVISERAMEFFETAEERLQQDSTFQESAQFLRQRVASMPPHFSDSEYNMANTLSRTIQLFRGNDAASPRVRAQASPSQGTPSVSTSPTTKGSSTGSANLADVTKPETKVAEAVAGDVVGGQGRIRKLSVKPPFLPLL